MPSLVEMLGKQLGGGAIGQISKMLGSDEKTTGSAVSAALPMLFSALARNSAKPDGAAALSSALEKDHDGSLLDNLGGFLGNPEAGPGAGILSHILGGKRPAVENGIGKATGMNAASVGKLLMTLAPIVMATLGRTKKESGMDASGIAGLLGQERAAAEQQAPREMGLFGKLLDADGDGDVDLSDIAKHGLGSLGKLFGGR